MNRQPNPINGRIEATGLRKRYGDVVALDGLDLTVPEGTILGLLGPNGAGKTTAVSILTTLLRADGGHATVAGADIATSPTEVRRRIGLSGQYAAVDENLTGYENLDMIGRLYHLGRKRAGVRARTLLERFMLTDAGDRPVKTYSGGMRRRLDLAGALVAEPPVLFLDEPTTGLDPRSRNELWKVIQELVDRGRTVLLTTQYMEEADQLADDIVVIDHGRQIAHGSTDELKAMVGGERIEISLPGDANLDAARQVLSRFSTDEPHVDDRTLTAPIVGGAANAHASVAGLRPRKRGGARRRLASTDPRRRVPRSHWARRGLRQRSELTSRTRPRTIAPTREGGRVMESITLALTDGATITRRNIIRITRMPELLVAVVIMPLVFVLLFAYVFGSAIEIEGGSYREFLIGGAFVMMLTFGSTFTGLGLADDMQKGIIQRFRSLPMSRSAVVFGRTASDVIYNLLSTVVMVGAGYAVGWRISNGIGHALLGFGLVLLFAYAFSWIMAYVGLAVGSVEAINNASSLVIFPLTFIANTFVPTDDFPTPLRIFAEWNPVSTVAQAAREQFGKHSSGRPGADGLAPRARRDLLARLGSSSSSASSPLSQCASTRPQERTAEPPCAPWVGVEDR